MRVCVSACACVCVCERVYVCVCVCVSVCVCVCMYMYMHRFKHVRICMRLCRDRTTSCNATGFFARPSSALSCAAGVTFIARTLSAPWAGRYSHTSVIDAAGAIYVLGGLGSGATRFQDAWVSTDGGARAGLARTRQSTRAGYSGGFLRGLKRCTLAVLGVLQVEEF